MKLRCLRIRPNGTIVQLGATAYHFKPNAIGHHVAEVADKAHLATLLKIAAYVPYLEDEDGAADEGEKADNPEPEQPAAPAAAPPDEGAVAEAEAADEAARAAAADGGETAPFQPTDEGEKADNPAVVAEIEALDDEAAVERFRSVMGREPHPKAKIATIKQKLIEAATADAE